MLAFAVTFEVFPLKLALFCLLAGVVPGWGVTRGAKFSPITLYTQFDQAPPKCVLQALHDEVASIMAPTGLFFEWRNQQTGGHGVSAELAVVTFTGRCDTASLMTHAQAGGALGWTHVSDGQILPFTEVSCDRVREFLGPGLLQFAAEDREEKYGRALGRVLAHELYHIFANTMWHGSNGVAKASYGVQDLLGNGFRFQPKESRMLQVSRRTPPLEVAAGTM